MSFQQALSGLSVANASLNAIGNNIANGSTAGFKGAIAQFADVFATSMQGGGTSSVGIGAQVDGIRQQFTQGNLTTTNNPLDVAINGGGFFRMDNNGSISYTRNGQFLLDKEGYIINNGGLKLTGYAADPNTGAIVPGNIYPLQIRNEAIPPAVTTRSQIQVNLDSRAKPPESMTHGVLTSNGSPTMPHTITAGNDAFEVTVDGVTVSVTLPSGSYASPGELATALQTAINSSLGPVAPTVKVDVTVDNANNFIVTSRSVGSQGALGQGSTVSLAASGTNTGFDEIFDSGSGSITTSDGIDAFSPTNTNSYTASTAQTVFDSLGNPHTLSLYYVKTSEPGKWQLYTTMDAGVMNGPTELVFNGTGTLVTPASGVKLPQNFDVHTGAVSPLTFDLDLSGTTQYGIAFGTNQLIQDGYTSGKLSGLSISSDGIVQGRYSNGQSRNMGQVVLANFNNPNGLQSLGNNLWAETTESGSPIPGGPGTGNLGLVKSGALEDSNVDMTSELVNMITAQRAYQANAQSIKTQDQIMQTLVNLR
ncbi:conserved protein of unknown function [Sterolibacterium denitrificans]|uniref:Flagellar hook protein FlgE n=1 Tax=Sterolibacterium denitrificans TaxID=157592 RepID=A0A7Z7HT92_9PROT|nr:flagellar hook protein FlgE [Sterolibacterium denitrificans]SMB30717.1 conserved protein of unknown function [Sterolibacterium denitrificans]